MTPQQFRRLALALPDAVEGAHHGHPDFRAHGRIFASIVPAWGQGMVRVPLAVQKKLVGRRGGAFVAANGAWGRAGATMVNLADAVVGEVRAALLEAWQFAAADAEKRAAKKPRAQRAPKR
ncbi:MAG: MmcQ/YjbR family DNA-binding protein [Planctomycetota bacterium]